MSFCRKTGLIKQIEICHECYWVLDAHLTGPAATFSNTLDKNDTWGIGL